MKTRNQSHTPRRHMSKAKLLALLGCLTLLAGMVVPFYAGADAGADHLYEGWSHFSLTEGSGGTPPTFHHNDESNVSYDADTHAFTFNTLDTGKTETLYLNAEFGGSMDSSAANINKFGYTAMKDFVVEYDVNVAQINGSGTLEFAFISQPPNGSWNGDLTMASITLGHTDSHKGVFWSRGSYWTGTWVQLQGNGWNDLGGVYGDPIGGTGSHHVKITKTDWTVSVQIDDGEAVSASIDSDKGLPESGYMGFYARNAKATISNVTVTNSGTGISETFFAAPDPVEANNNVYEGWNHYSLTKGNPPTFHDDEANVSYDEDTRAFTLNALGTGRVETLLLNADFGEGKTSSADNIAKFGKDAMKDFVVEYDVELLETGSSGMIEFAFMNAPPNGNYNGDLTMASITAGNTDAHTYFWCRGSYWIGNSWVSVGGQWNELGGFSGNVITGTGVHHMKITKEGWEISLKIDDEIAYVTELPSDKGLPESGYMGFYAQNAEAVISNVKVTNSTTGETAIFFGDGISNVPAPSKEAVDIEGWTGFCNQQTEATSHYYQRDGEGALFFDGMYCDADFLYLNSPYGTSDDALDNAAKFGVDTMTDFTVDFDFSLRDMMSDIGGALNFAFCSESEVNPGLASTVLQMNGSATGFKYEYHIVGNYDLLPDTNPDNVLVGNDAHHVTIQKEGRNITITIDGYAAWENYTLPETIASKNSEPDHPTPQSGYMAFWFRNAKGYIANVKVTNDVTNESKTFFEDYGKSLDFWEMGGGDTTNLLAVTPEKGTGVRGESSGESPDNTTLKYILPLDLKDLTFDFIPKTVTTSNMDSEAWMGFALTNSDRDFNPEVPAKSSGFVAEIQSRNDGTATITFKSLLPDETYGQHTATYEMASFQADTAYTFGTKYTDAGLEVYLNDEKIATLDWLKGVYRNGLGYLTTTASCTDGFPQEWVVASINGENAVEYDSGLFDDGGFGDDDDDDNNNNPGNTPGTEPGDNNGNGSGTGTGDGNNAGDGDNDSPATGFGGPVGALWILAAAAVLTVGAVSSKKLRKA